MIGPLLTALIVIAIICIVVNVVVRLVPMPPPVSIIIWAVTGIICLLVLYDVVTGHRLLL